MDSTLILEYAEALARPRSLMPSQTAALRQSLRVIGLALAACEKSVQIVYERAVRPPEKRHAPWVERVTGQMLAACAALEAEFARQPLAATSEAIDQAGITAAVVWDFTQHTMPDLVPAANHPLLASFSAEVEALPAFIAAPYGDSTYRDAG